MSSLARSLARSLCCSLSPQLTHSLTHSLTPALFIFLEEEEEEEWEGGEEEEGEYWPRLRAMRTERNKYTLILIHPPISVLPPRSHVVASRRFKIAVSSGNQALTRRSRALHPRWRMKILLWPT